MTVSDRQLNHWLTRPADAQNPLELGFRVIQEEEFITNRDETSHRVRREVEFFQAPAVESRKTRRVGGPVLALLSFFATLLFGLWPDV